VAWTRSVDSGSRDRGRARQALPTGLLFVLAEVRQHPAGS
jgi:hypothetical protein